MAYATATDLRDRYRRGLDQDAFANLDDADLDQALVAASSEIDSWRPQAADLGAAALAVLRDKTLTLARMHAYQDQALDDAHPIIRDAKEVRDWLKALSRGAVHLPVDGVGADTDLAPSPAAPQVSAPAERFGADFLRRQ